MNEPLISPWVFYLLGLLDPLNMVFIMTTGLLAIASVMTCIDKIDCENKADAYANKDNDGYYKKQAHRASRRFYVVFISSIICMFFAIFIPTKTTVIQMIVASKVTPANINTAADIGEKTVDKIIDKIIQSAKKYNQVTK